MADDDFEPFRARLRVSLLTLLAVREGYIGLLAELPVSPHEADMLEGRLPLDFPTEIRGVLECVLADALSEGLIETLRDAAEYQPAPQSPPADPTRPPSLRHKLTRLLQEAMKAPR